MTGVPSSQPSAKISSASSSARSQAATIASAAAAGIRPDAAAARARAASTSSIDRSRLAEPKMRRLEAVEKPGSKLIQRFRSYVEEHRLVIALQADVEPIGRVLSIHALGDQRPAPLGRHALQHGIDLVGRRLIIEVEASEQVI